jgi:hypothetical protein
MKAQRAKKNITQIQSPYLLIFNLTLGLMPPPHDLSFTKFCPYPPQNDEGIRTKKMFII